MNLLITTLPLFLLLGCAHTINERRTEINSAPLCADEIERRFILPPTTAKNVIYLMIAHDKRAHLSPYHLREHQQIDWRNLKAPASSSVFNKLLALEISIRKMLALNPDLIRAVVYVGQAKDLTNRALGHKRDFINPIKQMQTTKGRWITATLKKYSVEMSYLVKNIPSTELNLAECLIGHLFAVQDFKGSAKLGDTKSWQEIIKYFSWQKRLTTLEGLNLLHSVEVKREQIRETILPFSNPWKI